MTPTIQIIDNFLENPNEVRECALSLPDREELYDGHVYHGWRRYENQWFKQKMEGELASVFQAPIELVLHAFVAATKKFSTTQWIHADLIGAAWAAVLHLHKGVTGTAFWRHRASGCESLCPDFVRFCGGTQETVERMNSEGQTADYWDLASLAGSAFNRLIVYPSSLFHSRYPKDAFGESDEDGRLTWVGFYNVGGAE